MRTTVTACGAQLELAYYRAIRVTNRQRGRHRCRRTSTFTHTCQARTCTPCTRELKAKSSVCPLLLLAQSRTCAHMVSLHPALDTVPIRDSCNAARSARYTYPCRHCCSSAANLQARRRHVRNSSVFRHSTLNFGIGVYFCTCKLYESIQIQG